MDRRSRKTNAGPSKPGSETDPPTNIWSFVAARSTKSWFVCISLFAVLIRLAVALHPYSGAGTPPMFGDYEAQRHWMEITVNLPVKDWYRNTTVNDLAYWGLDYPPLTAYQSYFHGILLRLFDPPSVSLVTSRGYESYIGKLLMRWTVLMSDVMIFFPAVLYFATVYYSGKLAKDKTYMAWHVVMILLNPCLILIDHGHFQYNCISLGLTVAAVAAILSNKDLVGSFLFCLALNHKQMSAYYAPAFFSFLLGKCLRRHNPLFEILKLGFVVMGTFALVWWPYLYSIDAFLEVLSRLAPFERGLYEDYVANLWCATSIIIKWKQLFSTDTLRLFCLAATALSSLPSMIQLVWSPTKLGFLHGLANCSSAFYLFSYQVHEKSILLPLLPASFLAMEEPFIFQWLIFHGLLSMFPLLKRDKLVIPYTALYLLFILLYRAPGGRNDTKETDSISSILKSVSFAISILLHMIYMAITPPDKYPFLFEAIIMMFCFAQFLLVFIYLNTKQWQFSENPIQPDTKKKKL
ncbi:probable dolichyl pyrophosphate Man9GlcNAc2 alpha-1,3-glucosyltransferase isoform X2 [Andrographis paniculata]|uniref:probable dolichyl pyrophosphate Man9GlcNAc2 alpha-1,3-glucosyltransferase isoform X2 n=1 Tax=Andrographis paniculata TaxID=175694 RepID=UPI0021E784B4|nr:probable dolichyl pyrophosphate Man9GlcNAc2 alpha-1,3-glucosyltransferase isoform X2 [Andrographis paniculata]